MAYDNGEIGLNAPIKVRLVAEEPPAGAELPEDFSFGDEFVLAVLTSIVSLTPGTVSAGRSPDRRVLLLHVLDAPNPDEIVEQVKTRYEAPLLEIFECSRM